MSLTDRLINWFSLIFLIVGTFFGVCLGLSLVMPDTAWPSIIGQRLGHAGATGVITAMLGFMVLDNRKLRAQIKVLGNSK